MPVDTSIYRSQPQPFNNPFEVLGQLQHLQGQQQILASNKALEQERQQKLKDDQRKQAEADNFNAIIGNPSLTPETFLEQVRVHAPEHYLSTQKSFQEAQKAAGELKARQDEANAKVQEASQQYTANLARQVDAQGNTPTAFELAMKLHQQAFPESKTPDELRAYVKEQGPDAIKQITSALMRSNASVSQAADKTAETAAELPGKTAESTIKTQVAAGTVGGLTPEQQRQAKDAAARLGVEQGRLKVEQDRAAAAATSKTGGRPLPAMEASKISDIDKGISAIRDLRESINTGSTGFVARAEAALVPNAMADFVPGAASAKATQADIVRAQQVVGRLIHGGVMRANDAAAAAQYMPQLGDAPSVIKSKLDKAEAAGLKTRADHLGNLGKAGYDVSNFEAADTTPAPAASLAPGKVQRVVQDGVTYDVVTDPQGKVLKATPVR